MVNIFPNLSLKKNLPIVPFIEKKFFTFMIFILLFCTFGILFGSPKLKVILLFKTTGSLIYPESTFLCGVVSIFFTDGAHIPPTLFKIISFLANSDTILFYVLDSSVFFVESVMLHWKICVVFSNYPQVLYYCDFVT